MSVSTSELFVMKFQLCLQFDFNVLLVALLVLYSLQFDGDELPIFFLLELVDHQGVIGCGAYCHANNANHVFRNIDKWHKIISETEMKVTFHEDACKLSDFQGTLCWDYFERYFDKLAKEGPIILPQISSGVNKIVDIMQRWCIYTNDSSSVKGLVIHNFNMSEYFGKLFYEKFDKEKLREDMNIKDFPSTPIIIVYNPSQNVILLIRISGKEALREQIEFCSTDMKMFILLHGDEFKHRKVRVISLLASNGIPNEELKCQDCKNYIVPYEVWESEELFQNWLQNHAENLKIDTGNTNEANIIAVSAQIIGFLAAVPNLTDLPTFTEDPTEQMKHFLDKTILTSEQKSILYSKEKHLIIKGPYGCGKSIIARKKLQMLSDDIKRSEKSEELHFVCLDSNSALLSEIATIPNVMGHGNKEGKNLSQIVKGIMKETHKKVNLIVDEYDGEQLDMLEAEALNSLFNKRFQDTTVYICSQSMEKERNLSINEKSEKENRNRFDLLRNFKQVDLNFIMRNSVEVSRLISVTQNFLRELETVHQHPREKDESKYSANLEEFVEELVVSSSDSETKETVTIKSTKPGKKKAIHINNQGQQSIRELVPSEANDIKKCVNKTTYKVTENSGETVGLTGENSGDVESQDKSVVGLVGLDEAFAFAEIPRAKGIIGKNVNRIVSRFRYTPSSGTGHNITSHYPKLFQVDYGNGEKHCFERFYAMTCIFKKLKIQNSNSSNKHIILHFDTSISEIPTFLEPVIEYFDIKDKVTNCYEIFKYDKKKCILVCNFRLLRGLEFSNVTIVIDQDIYFMQHYLVEVMSRCTVELNVVVLEMSDIMSKIIAQWVDGLNGLQLIDHWKIQISKEVEKVVVYHEDTKSTFMPMTESLENLEKMKKIFDKHGKKNRAWNVKLIAKKIIQKR